jgi:HPt (histidine-containing phosphotransfer) domain-containing protein
MDDYIRKPLNFQQLTVTLRRWLHPSNQEIIPTLIPHFIPSNPYWQKEKLLGIDSRALENIMAINQNNGHDVLTRVINLYLENSNNLVEKLREGLNSKDFATIAAAAHKLVSSSATLGAQKLAALCRQLEIICQCQFTEKAGSIFLNIRIEHKKVCKTLAAISDNGVTGPTDSGQQL